MTPLLRVRLVDDDDDLRAAQRQTLTLAGFKVEDFAAAAPALAGLDADFPADLRVCERDTQQKVMGGYCSKTDVPS